MEGPIRDADDLWLFNFRRRVSSACSALEFAKDALTYDPYLQDAPDSVPKPDREGGYGRFAAVRGSKCPGVKLLDVASLFNLGKSSFIPCHDVKINLCKIYVYLTEAMARLKAGAGEGDAQGHAQCLAALEALFSRFDDYVKICMHLSQTLKYKPVAETKSDEARSSTARQSTKFAEITAKFKVDQQELSRLVESDLEGSESRGGGRWSKERLTLQWSFYRDATCSDIFALLCYTLLTGNPFAFKTILDNSTPCMKSHLRENWRVLLSYVPISFDFKDYQYAFEAVLFVQSSEELTEEALEDERALLLSFLDWCLWRIFLIIKYTNSSYFLFIRFIKNLFKLFAPLEDVPGVAEKLQVLNFLKFIIKQYFIYKSLNSNIDYKDHLRTVGDKGLNECMTFFEYLDLDASKKLSLFCEFDVSAASADCACDEQYKDKHKIYPFCLRCKTSNLANKLNSFFVLISPAPSGATRQSGTSTAASPTRGEAADLETRRQSIDNEYLPMSLDFRDFYQSLLRSYNSTLNDYITGISESFMKHLNVHSFEILYALSAVLLETGFRNKVLTIFLKIVYGEHCKYNFLESYFLIKSTFNLIVGTPDLKFRHFDTKGTLFKHLWHLDTATESKTAHSTYKKLQTSLRALDLNAGFSDGRELVFPHEILVDTIRCHLDFAEVLLNLLAILGRQNSNLEVTPLELVLALVNEEHLLLLMQKILFFLVDIALDPPEFGNCLFELVNLSQRMSNLSPVNLHSMFFYTIAAQNNLNYLNQQLQLWYQGAEGAPGEDRRTNLERDEAFLSASLDCVLNVVYRKDLLFNTNLFHLLISYCNFVPKNNRFYDTHFSVASPSIYSVISLYLNFVNSNTNLSSGLGTGKMGGALRESLDRLDMLLALCKVYKSLLIFDTSHLRTRRKRELLDYSFRDPGQLLSCSLSSLLSLLQTRYLDPISYNRGVAGSRVISLADKRERMLLVVFKSLVDELISTSAYSDEVFDDFRVVVGQLCPKELTGPLFGLVNILSSLDNHSALDLKNYLAVESDPVALNGLCVNLLFILCMGALDLLLLSNLLQFCVSSQLSNSVAFLYKYLMGNMVYNGPPGRGLEPARLGDNARVGGSDEPFEPQHEVRVVDTLDLFAVDSSRDTSEDGCFEILDFRRSVLSMLDLNRPEKHSVKESIGKFANKFGHNAASDFITAAIEKAEGELLNIAKRTNKLDMLKDRLSQHKRGHSHENDMYAPVLNYFEATPLSYEGLCDQFHEGLNELLQYRNLREVSVSNLVPLDPELACLMLMENCSYTCNEAFMRDIRDVFNKNDLRNVASFLHSLMPYLRHSAWPAEVVDRVSTVEKFLWLFTDFPENVVVVLSQFVFNHEYRLELFKSIPTFVAANLHLVQDIYRQLGRFSQPESEEKTHTSVPPAENLWDYLFGDLTPLKPDESLTVTGTLNSDDVLRATGTLGQGAGEAPSTQTQDAKLLGRQSTSSFDGMDEYVEVLFSVYEEIFLDFRIDSFLELEPLFLLNPEKYLYFLLKLYYNLTSSPASPSSIQSSSSIGSFHTSSFVSPRSPIESNVGFRVTNGRLLVVRRSICNFLQVYPELRDSFSVLYRPDSLELLRFLECVFAHLPDFDLSCVDNFELFKQRLINALTLENFFFVVDSVQSLDPAFAAAVYRRLEHRLRPHSDDIVDCTRLLFEYDLSSNTL